MTMNVLTGNDITIENCRFLLGEGQEDKVSDDYTKTFLSLPDGERFDIAKHLLSEIEFYNNTLRSKASPGSNQLKLHLSLLDSFQNYGGISYEDFSGIMSNGYLCVVAAYLIRNISFPVALLLDPSLLEPYKNNPYAYIVEEHIYYAKIIRRPELAAYYRGIIPNSEHMSDKMVLSVAGVKV